MHSCEIDAEYFPSQKKSSISPSNDLSSGDLELLNALEDLASLHIFAIMPL
jgi:hypothetical protein